jgi:hypothetical protein
MENTEYRQYFINRSADMFNTMLLPQNILNTIDFFKDRLAPEMPNHLMKWGGNFTGWEAKVQTMKNFASNRLSFVWQQYMDEFSLTKLITIHLDVDSTKHGKIKINTIIPDSLPWQGIYFDGNPVEIAAIPDSGYIFSHWKTNMVISGSDTLQQFLKINADTNDLFKAFFLPDTFIYIAPKIIFSEINYHSSDTLDAGDWIEILNIDTTTLDLSGWIFKDGEDTHNFILPTETILDSGRYLVICRDTTKFQSIYIDTIAYVGPFEFGLANEGDELRLFDNAGMLVVTMAYSNLPPWPTNIDGTGKTLELDDPFGDLNDGSNWFSGCFGGSPGSAFTPCDTVFIFDNFKETEQIRIYPNPSRTIVFVEIYSNHNDEIILTLYNTMGNPLLNYNLNLSSLKLNTIPVNISKIYSGAYFITIKGRYINHAAKIFIR